MGIQIPAGYWDLDLASRELLLCPRSRQMFGIIGSEPRRLRRLDWLPRIHPDDMAMVASELEAARRGDKIYSARFRTVRPDGSICHVLGVGRASAGNPTRFVGLNLNLETMAAAVEREPPMPFARMAKLTSLRAFRSKPANENASPRENRRAWSIRRAEGDLKRRMLLQRALAVIEMRRLGHKFLNPIMSGEPAFDMLLALYVTTPSPKILSIRTLSPDLGVSESAAARWLKALVNEGLALSVGDDDEPSSISAALTDKGRILLEAYLQAIGRPRF